MPGKAGASAARKLTCEEWEAMLVDFLDGTLAVGDPSSAFIAASGRAAPALLPAEMFTQAGQGREWLSFLRVRARGAVALVGRIMAQTSGTEPRPGLNGDLRFRRPVAIPIAQACCPSGRSDAIVSGRRRVAQPRLLMTAAMAFFSITLTLNMAGVRLTTSPHGRPESIDAELSNLNKQYHIDQRPGGALLRQSKLRLHDGSAGKGDAPGCGSRQLRLPPR